MNYYIYSQHINSVATTTTLVKFEQLAGKGVKILVFANINEAKKALAVLLNNLPKTCTNVADFISVISQTEFDKLTVKPTNDKSTVNSIMARIGLKQKKYLLMVDDFLSRNKAEALSFIEINILPKKVEMPTVPVDNNVTKLQRSIGVGTAKPTTTDTTYRKINGKVVIASHEFPSTEGFISNVSDDISSIAATLTLAAQMMANLPHAISKCDLEISDLLHLIEFEKPEHLNTTEVITRLNAIRKQRRVYKDELHIAELFTSAFSNLDISQLINVANSINELPDRTYHMRETALVDLLPLANFGKL